MFTKRKLMIIIGALVVLCIALCVGVLAFGGRRKPVKGEEATPSVSVSPEATPSPTNSPTPTITPTPLPVGNIERVYLDNSTLGLKVGEEKELELKLIPDNITEEYKVSSYSSEPKVVSCENGCIKALAPGEAVVVFVVKAKSGTYMTSCKVNSYSTVEGIKLSEEEITINQGESKALKVSPIPEEAADTLELSFSSSDTGVAKVSADGKVTGVSNGTAVIKVSYMDKTASCVVTVKNPLKGIRINSTELTLVTNTEWKLGAELTPVDTTDDKTISWSSSDTSVLTVSNGVLKTISEGEATVTASCGQKSDSIKVVVLDASDAVISLNASELKFTRLNEKFQLKTAIEPAKLSALSVKYTSSNKAVALVSEDGVITAKGNGTAVIKAKCAGKTASVKVTVERETGIVIVLDPGHDSSHGGDHTGSFYEEVLNLKVAKYCKEYLENNYSGITVYLTRNDASALESDRRECLKARTQFAEDVGASIFVSLHFNALNGAARGGEVLVSQYYTVADETRRLGACIMKHIAALGIIDKGLVPRKSEDGEYDDEGRILDYYSVIRGSAVRGIPGVIVEHCFMDNAQDQQFINSDEKLKKLGIADAKGIADYLGL